ncbi:cyclodeaminase/cyclohydrolase family protein [Sporomusa aerivorans]|uniref:cyclodeaminase/cyclohydrolase family protein n=1 Tax=Sporomusa aerivorans TaxID=204936 RepID=UPI00352B89CF
MLSSLSVSDFAAKLASDEVPPGGGSAAAVGGLLGTSLVEMAINYSLKSPKLVECNEFLIAKQAELARIHIELNILIDRDALALRGLLAAAGLPETTQETKQTRNIALQKALKQAAEVPLETARACLEVVEIGKTAAAKVDKVVVSDLMAGVAAAHAGMVSSLLSTAINLSEIQDEALVSALKGQIFLLQTAADELKAAIEDKVYGTAPFSVLRGE